MESPAATPPPTPTPLPGEEVTVDESLSNRNQDGLLISLIIGFVVLALSLVLYDILRRLLPAVYYWRNVYAGYTEVAADDEGRPLPSEPMPPRWPLSPIWRAMRMSSSEIQEVCCPSRGRGRDGGHFAALWGAQWWSRQEGSGAAVAVARPWGMAGGQTRWRGRRVAPQGGWQV